MAHEGRDPARTETYEHTIAGLLKKASVRQHGQTQNRRFDRVPARGRADRSAL